jgi:hypothetical protein
VRQFHATADAEVFFQQHLDGSPAAGARPGAAAAAAAGPYAALWLHPEDAEQLAHGACGTGGPPPPAASRASSAAPGAPPQPLPPLPAKPLTAAAAPKPAAARGGAAAAAAAAAVLPPGLAALPAAQPFVPLLRARHLVVQLATQILNEPSVPGSEATHTTVHAAGVQAWLSPWQVWRGGGMGGCGSCWSAFPQDRSRRSFNDVTHQSP